MNYKQVLKLGLPVVAVLSIILVVAAVLGRENPTPKLSNNEVVIDFKGYKLTSNELYRVMKSDYGFQTLHNFIILPELLKDVEVDEEAIWDKIEEEMEEDRDKFYKDLLNNDYLYPFEGESEEDFLQRVFAKRKLTEQVTAYARSRVLITDTEKNSYDTYVPDIDVMQISFDTQAKVDEFLAELEALKAKYNLEDEEENKAYIEELIKTFEKKWVDPKDKDKTYFDKDYEHKYDRRVYKEEKEAFQKLAFEELKINEYKQYTDDKGKLSVVLKVGTAEKMTKERYIELLIEEKLTSAFKNNELQKLIKSATIKIYDEELAETFNDNFGKNVYAKFDKEKPNLLAIVNGKAITTDELYYEMKIRFGVYSTFNEVNYTAVSIYPQLKLTKSDLKDIDTKVNQMKYYVYIGFISWSQLGVKNEQDYRNSLIRNTLYQRYVLGYNGFEGGMPVTLDLIKSEYGDWLNIDGKYADAYEYIQASHILFKFDKDGDGETTEAEKERARKLADQIINGVTDENRLENDEDNIKYEDQDFTGLKNVSEEDFKKVFEALASKYGEDSAKSNKGNLGKFGPTIYDNTTGYEIRMVKEFEDAALKTDKGKYTVVETEYGWHVVYVTDKKVAPTRPNDFFSKSIDEIKDLVAAGNEAYANYYKLIEKLWASLQEQHVNAAAINFALAELRDELDFKYHDPIIQQHYQKLHKQFIDTYKENNEKK